MKQYKNYLLLLILAFLSLSGIELSSKSGKDYIKVIYFHGDYRCETCNTLEKYSEEVLKERFSGALKSQKIIWDTINFDKEKNKKYLDKYGLYNQALIIIKYENGKDKKWKNLEKIWELVSDRSDYFDYVEKEIRKFKN